MLQKMQQIPINFLKQPKKNSVSPQTEQIEFTLSCRLIQLIISESGKLVFIWNVKSNQL